MFVPEAIQTVGFRFFIKLPIYFLYLVARSFSLENNLYKLWQSFGQIKTTSESPHFPIFV